MKIAIIGGGAIGLLFSYYISQKHEVTLFTRTIKQAEKINKEGIYCIDGEKSQQQQLESKQITDWDGRFNLTLVTVKEHQLAELMPVINEKIDRTDGLLFLQNGMGHLKWLNDCLVKNIYIGSVEHGAARINENTVSHNGHGMTRLSIFTGDLALIEAFITEAQKEFPFILEDDYLPMLIKKLLVNTVINPLTASLHVTNGTLLTNPFFYKIAVQLFEEAAKVLELQEKEVHFQNLLSVCKQTASNHSSMLKDLEAGRKTEVDAILGYLLERAGEKGIETPLISNYYHLIKGIEVQRGGV